MLVRTYPSRWSIAEHTVPFAPAACGIQQAWRGASIQRSRVERDARAMPTVVGAGMGARTDGRVGGCGRGVGGWAGEHEHGSCGPRTIER